MITTRSVEVAKAMENTAEARVFKANWRKLIQTGAGGYLPPILDEKRLFCNVLPDGSWEGNRCFIVGGGPSLKDFDFSSLRGELTIGINRAIEGLDCTIMFFMDRHYWEWVTDGDLGERMQRKFQAFKGHKVCLYVDQYDYPRDIYLLRCAGNSVFGASMRDGLGSGTNSGYAALNLAVCLGANPIYLLGFDMSGSPDGKRHWWHDAYPQSSMKTGEKVYRRFMKDFERIAPELKSKGVRVVNLNPQSALRCFEFGDFDDISRKDNKK